MRFPLVAIERTPLIATYMKRKFYLGLNDGTGKILIVKEYQTKEEGKADMEKQGMQNDAFYNLLQIKYNKANEPIVVEVIKPLI